ncbi:alpha-hydroxy-acid oxidizing protein [Oscillospiraceae bacterium HV4-5-C5C]|nr:alpha-hydroxy-acid oxidizing protein [Oscillospiraceae bacterium HV4-5-C5C]
MDYSIGAGDANAITRDYLDHILLESRYIDAAIPDLSFHLFGETFSSPIMTAAFSHLDKIYKGLSDGMVKLAAAAQACGVVMWAGDGPDDELKRMAETGARIIRIIKPFSDDAEIYRQIKLAESCGVLAVGMDIDHSFNHRGDYDRIGSVPMRAQSLSDLQSYCRATKLPFVIKGVLSVGDAQKASLAGAAGLVVSHHHGMLPYAVPPLMILPDIVRVIDRAIPIFADCGIISGIDAYKALALGAAGVGLSRELISALLKNGEEGAEAYIAARQAELKGAMARTGIPTLSYMDPAVLHFKSFS